MANALSSIETRNRLTPFQPYTECTSVACKKHPNTCNHLVKERAMIHDIHYNRPHTALQIT